MKWLDEMTRGLKSLGRNILKPLAKLDESRKVVEEITELLKEHNKPTQNIYDATHGKRR